MAASITWLHLSDLHACNPLTGWDAGDVLADLRADLGRLRDAHGLSPDLIFFTGDAGFGHLGTAEGKSLAGQLDQAEGFFRGVRETCGVDQDRFFLVPGNHDVHRGKVNASDTAWLDAMIGGDDADAVALLRQGGTQWQSVVGRLGEYRAFLERHGYDHLLDDPGRLLFTSVREIAGVKLGVAGFNTAWSCCRSPERGKLWWGGRWQVKELAGRLADCGLRVALTHHPGGWFTEAEDPAVDDMLKRRFDLRLHGHEHRGWLELMSRVTEERDHLRISAGACYAASEKEKGYNFGRLDPSTGTVEVFFRRYDEAGEGWVAHQIAHRTQSDGRWRSEPLRQLAPARKTRTAPRTLLASDLVGGADLPSRLGDEGAARVEQRYDLVARELMTAQRGREIDRTGGFLLLFDRPIDALRYAVSYHDALDQLGEELAGEKLDVELTARVGIHHGEVVEGQGQQDAAEPVKITEAARQVTNRVAALAGARQTLLTWSAFQIASRGAVGQPEADELSWRPHGRYTFQGQSEPVEVFEAGRPDTAPLVPPKGYGKAERLDQPDDERSRRLARELAEARARRDVLRRAKKSTAEIDAEIVRLHRELREGGHLNPGDVLCDGRFQLVEKLGEGGYAVVWKAWDAKRLEPVALKVLHGQHVRDLSRRERFFRGARQMAELVVGVVEVVEKQLADGGFHFYAMELLEGGDFQRACQQGRLTLDERLRVITRVADALDQAHARGVIHRDVKPSNILLDAGGSPRLTDFDLVLAGDTTGGTRTQGMLGTFLYMAPEVMIDAREACPASDVFSLGMTAIFAVYGDELPPAVFKDGDGFVARLHAPEALRAVLRRAIAWELEERFASMAELGSALRRAMAAGASPELPAAAVLRIEAGMHGAMINRVDVDAAGRFLVTGSDDKTARVWDLRRGELLRVLRPPIGEGDEGKVYAVALTPDGEVVAVGGWIGYERDQNYSIYLFERRGGRLLRRIAGLPNVVLHLVFSPDGLRLAAVLWGANGLRVFRVTDGEELHRDVDYGAASYGASFDAAGRLVTTCSDGRLRLYAADHQRLAVAPAPGGALPFAVAFSPEGGRIAVGYDDSTRVDVVSGDDLALLYSAESGGTNRDLSGVAFSDDGGVLFAAGRFNVDGRCLIRRWDDGGRGAFRDLPGPLSTVMDLRALPGGRLVYGAADPAWGVYEGDRMLVDRGPAMADPRGLLEDFRINAAGTRVRFAFEAQGKRPALFSLAERRLEVGEAALAASGTLEGPRTTAPEGVGPGVEVTGWNNTTEPCLNGQRLPLEQHETSFSLALAADASGFLLGTNWTLRFFTRDGEERWQKPVPGVVWAVNLTPDTRLALAAYGDGTIRWHRAADGEELLAFFAHRDERRWVVWTPSGYWDASPGGETLIGWHVNRGDDREAVFHPAWRFGKTRHRPEVIDLILVTLDETEAVRRADAASAVKA